VNPYPGVPFRVSILSDIYNRIWSYFILTILKIEKHVTYVKVISEKLLLKQQLRQYFHIFYNVIVILRLSEAKKVSTYRNDDDITFISIHNRRTDYGPLLKVMAGNHELISKEYFSRAVSYYKAKYKVKNEKSKSTCELKL